MESQSNDKLPDSQQWDARLYDDKLSFVSRLGMPLLDLLKPLPGEAVLDLGCGTGDLAHVLDGLGCRVQGVDYSPDMIGEAKRKYPNIAFSVQNAEELRLNEPVDAILSNAALHWMKRPEQVIDGMWRALRPGGRVAAEFGGRGNIALIVRAIAEELEGFGIRAEERNPWYFPSLGQYAALLEARGFHVRRAEHFARPTPLAGGEEGLRHWLDVFGGMFFTGLSDAVREQAYRGAAKRARQALYDEGEGVWSADYVRLRILAVKPG